MMRPPLRVLHTEASTGWGGQELRILDEAAGLRARGHDVQIAAPADSPIFSAAAGRRIPCHAIPLDRRRVATLRALGGVLTSFRPEVIVTHSSSDSWLVAIATRWRVPRPAIVRMRHLSTPVSGGLSNRWLYGRVPARIVTTGEAIRAHLIAVLKLDPGRVTSIPTGADIARFRPGDRGAARAKLGLPADAPLIGIVATLRSWKGHRFLVDALADERLRQARLVVVGDGPQDAPLRAQVRAAGLEPRVHFAGRREDVPAWMQAFDVFALPSTGNEGVPQALAQALACALPVVTTPAGAIPEIVRDGETGLVVPPGDVRALAAAIARLLADRALADRLAAAGRRLVMEKFTQQAMLDGMERVLKDVAAAR